MNLVNQTVVHKTFGEGVVVAYDGNYITVKFSAKETKFVFPDIFTTFLKCKDANLQAELEAAFAAKEEAKAQKARNTYHCKHSHPHHPQQHGQKYPYLHGVYAIHRRCGRQRAVDSLIQNRQGRGYCRLSH